ncbi:hypothetical protein TTHERM_00055940 (macronuclear) [Tetrahymena thermophila SB210]|uniref:Uncharacterized protein n=1 Tax=Tetrahymena thermophila (strain SB210) TaxID=312017 RepID=I7MDB7_TETTS|nr:hypothetical protein TTHERM_00055940 [Tetrahymena thermophila SB210]EAR87280.2 hypothetical protein TTHERM_00055940 [Tetrahymena thermophila SB210]|eukprot:XP_001007525.2 hypothetical protein TTHERM_00055940 [Tetrahymena thermophila SB210]
MDQLLSKHKHLQELIHEFSKIFTTKSGIQHIIQIIIFEIIRRKLPAMVRILQCYLFGRQKAYDDEEEEKDKDQACSCSSSQFENKDKLKKVLKEIRSSFFQQNWRDIAQHIHDEVEYHFNIEKLQNEIVQNLNIEKKQNQLETLKKEVFSFLPFSIVTSTLLICTEFLREVLKKKYEHSLKTDYPSLHDPQEITNQILNDFFEQINLVGLKNVKAYVKQKLPKNLQDLSLQESFHIEKIFKELDEYVLDILKSNSCLKKPADHKKRSSMTLFRNNRRKCNPPSSHQINFSEYNDTQYHENGIPCLNLHHLITQRNNAGGSNKQTTNNKNSALLPHDQPVIAPHSKLDLIYLFLGDISENKILNDTEYIEKHIEIVDCRCREQRYQPSLQCIPEAEDDGYESDRSDQLPHSSNSNGNGASSSDYRPMQRPNIQYKQHQNLIQVEEGRRVRKYSDGLGRNTVNQDDYISKKEKYKDDYDEEEEEDEEDEENCYTKNDQFLLELKGSKKNMKKNLIEQHHQMHAQQKKEYHNQNDQFQRNFNGTNENGSSPQKVHKMNLMKFNVQYDNANFDLKKQLKQTEEEEEDLYNLKQLSYKNRFLSQEDGDEEDYFPNFNQQKKNKLPNQNNSLLQTNEGKTKDSTQDQMFLSKGNSPSPKGAFDTQEFISSDHEGSLVLDEEEIIENRQRLTHFLQSLCYEALEILESANFQTYLYYAILFQYKKFKNRYRIYLYENNLSKNIVLRNLINQIYKITDEHFLSLDAQEKCESVYLKYKNEVENLISQNIKNPPQQQIQIIKRIFEEIDQSIIIRESFEELTNFFIES